jgi:hypothetical protein
MAIAGVVSRVLATPLLKSVREFIREGRYTAPSNVYSGERPLVEEGWVKHPAAKGCTDDGTLAIIPIYIPNLD